MLASKGYGYFDMTKKVENKSTENNQLVRVTFEAPFSLRKRFKLKATTEDVDMKEALCQLMKAYVSGEIDLKRLK